MINYRFYVEIKSYALLKNNNPPGTLSSILNVIGLS